MIAGLIAELERLNRIGSSPSDRVSDEDLRWFQTHPLRTYDGYPQGWNQAIPAVVEWLRQRGPTEDDSVVETDRAALAEIIWHTSRADEGTISALGADIVAGAILASPWLADLVRRERAEWGRGVLDRLLTVAFERGIDVPDVIAVVTTSMLRERADREEPADATKR